MFNTLKIGKLLSVAVASFGQLVDSNDIQAIRDFEQWQQSECKTLGCTVQEHNKLLRTIDKMQSAGFPASYDDIKGIIVQPKELVDIPELE